MNIVVPEAGWYREKGVDPLFEYYNTNDDFEQYLFGANWYGQTFTVGSESHTVTSVKIKIRRNGSPGILILGIRATSGGLPVGGDLTYGNIDANLITDVFPGNWYEIPVTEYVLSANTQYAIVCRVPNGNETNWVAWRMDQTSPTYGGGTLVYSTNGGSSWGAVSSMDFMFEVWGNAVAGTSVIITLAGLR